MPYVSATVLKTTLTIASTYADADIVAALEAASRACDGYKNVPPGSFSASSQTRYYDTSPWDNHIDVDPINTVSSVTVDDIGDGTYVTTWTSGTDFVAAPYNNGLDGVPYTRLELLPQAGRQFPPFKKSVKVIGSFGWATTPGAVTQATSILAGRFLKRARETPYGILVVSGDAVAAARLGKIDPDVAFLLDNLPGSVPLMAV